MNGPAASPGQDAPDLTAARAKNARIRWAMRALRQAATNDGPYRARGRRACGRPPRDGFATRVVRCPDPLLPNGTPQQFVEAVYPRYASRSGLGGPFGSEASLREFFALELARLAKAAVLNQEFRVAPADCKTDQEPFTPTKHNRLSEEDQMKAFEDVDAGKVRVTAAAVPPDATRATAHVSVGNLGKQGEMTIIRERTPAGWRISDTLSPSGLPSLANIVAGVPPRPAARRPGTRARPNVMRSGARTAP